MNPTWKSPKTIIGGVAEGRYYFHRKEIVANIWAELEKGSSILIAAPRRVGKTSIMQHLDKNPKENYKTIFENIQGIDSERRFYETLYRLLLNCLSKSGKAKKSFAKFFKSRSITEIDIKGKIKFENMSVNFVDEIDNLLDKINNNKQIEHIVLLIDELPEVLYNINKNKKEEAVSILGNLRRWRQNEVNKKVLFVFAGSVGIHYVVNAINNRESDINDCAKVSCNPLRDDEIFTYIDWATEQATVRYNIELQEYLANKVQYFVPYFINLMLDAVDKIARKNENPYITKQQIDEAFDAIVKDNDYFADWKKRLSDYMSAKDFLFVNELLTYIAHKGAISSQKIYDISVKHEKTGDYMFFISDLEKDGYIMESNQKYVFIAPFLKAFWKRNNPVYNG
jgi:ABC-type lipoprotein export system ATPase subunit